jgi:hypothetical protein
VDQLQSNGNRPPQKNKRKPTKAFKTRFLKYGKKFRLGRYRRENAFNNEIVTSSKLLHRIEKSVTFLKM